MGSLFNREKKNDYFAMFVELIEFSNQSIDYLGQTLVSFNPDETVLNQKMAELHEIEHQADKEKHALTEKLVKEFITPIEREDILAITNSLDDVTDSIEDILQRIYMFHITEIHPEALEFVRIIKDCVEKLSEIYKEFHNFKSSKTIHKDIILLNELEEEGDRIYLKSMRDLFAKNWEPLEVMAWSDVYERMELCCDKCEYAGNLVEEVIMKNM